MSILGGYDMSFPGLSTSGGFSTGSGSSSGSGTSSGSSYSSGQGSSQQGTGLIPGMTGIYEQMLQENQANYGNMMDAYQNQLGSNQQALPGVYQGYGDLSGQVMNTLGMGQVLGQDGNWGVAAPAAQAIANTYQQQLAGNQQQLASRGLGNTTVGANMANQAAQTAAQSYGQLGAQLADKAAGYQASLGQAGLAARMQGLGLQTGLTQGALNPLATQFANTVGTLTGGYGSSQYSNQGGSQQQSQQSQQSQQGNQSQQGSGGSTGASGGGNPAGGVTGAPGGPAGGGGGTGGGGAGAYGGQAGVSGSNSGPGGTGSGVPGTPGYNPGGAYGPTGPNNTNVNPGDPYQTEVPGPGIPDAQVDEQGNNLANWSDPVYLAQEYEELGLPDSTLAAVAGLNERVLNGEDTVYQVNIDTARGIVATKDGPGGTYRVHYIGE